MREVMTNLAARVLVQWQDQVWHSRHRLSIALALAMTHSFQVIVIIESSILSDKVN